MYLADNTEVQILVDVWEGSVEIDELMLAQEQVVGIIPRFNGIGGGLRVDKGFYKQWDEARNFVRSPYIVYTPWATPRDNAKFIRDHLPKHGVRIHIDEEVQHPNITPRQEAINFQDFVNDISETYPCSIYTGPWFLPQLSFWPTNMEYWWARYPWALYPNVSQYISWLELRQKLSRMVWNPGPAPGKVRTWQCTADRYKMPGCSNRAIDINIFKGSLADLRKWIGSSDSVIPPVIENEEAEVYKVTSTSYRNIRNAPGTHGKIVGRIYRGVGFQIIAKTSTKGEPWGKLPNGNWVWLGPGIVKL